MTAPLPADFLALSRQLGADSMLIQGPGGNSSFKDTDSLIIKASGTELADAEDKEIFVEVDRATALAKIDEDNGHGGLVAKGANKHNLRPSIETTFHALLPQKYIFHYHSVRSICHSTSGNGREALRAKLSQLETHVSVPYRMPGVPLTREIARMLPQDGCNLIVLENHGLIVAGKTVAAVADLIDQVEQCLELEPTKPAGPAESKKAPTGWEWVANSTGLGTDARLRDLALQGSYYPDHVVFLGAGLPCLSLAELGQKPPEEFAHPAVIVEDLGTCIKADATTVQRAMLQCLTDVLYRLPEGWDPEPIGAEAEAQLLNWDAEKYRQALAARNKQ